MGRSGGNAPRDGPRTPTMGGYPGWFPSPGALGPPAVRNAPVPDRRKKKKKKKYRPARYAPTPVLSAADRHVVSRFSYGTTPQLVAEVQAAGGGVAWLDRQIATAYDDPAADARLADWWPDLHLDAAVLWTRQVTEVRGTWEVMADYARRLLARRLTSQRQVLEVMTEFFESHLHITATGDAQAVWRAPYGDVIRRHALGRYDEMLQEAITHPAMLIYLDQATSTKKAPNENLGRELLELHTVGVGSYTEDDVKASARILTGYRVDVWKTWLPSYRPEDHWTGPVRVGDFSDPNTDPDGRDLVRRYLAHLARRPETARRLARRLAVKFVRDDPSEALVERLAQTYLANGTAIAPVLRELVRSTEFKASRGGKLRDPSEDLVATYRAIGAKVARPSGHEDAANAMIWQTSTIGLAPMAWPRPDGQPLDNRAWATPARALASMEVHWALAGGWWPSKGVAYRQPLDWFPELPITFAMLVDHVSRLIHGRPSSAGLLKVLCAAVSLSPTEVITADHALVKWQFNRFLGAFLDHPLHYER